MTLKEALVLLYKRAIYYIGVPRCVGCDVALEFGDIAFCSECYSKFRETASRNCSVCSKLLSECSCSNTYLENRRIKKVCKVFRYINREENEAANKLIYSLKKDNRRDVISFSANELERAIRSSLDLSSDVIFTNVPRRRSSVLKYGYDHAEGLSRELAKRFGAKYLRVLSSSSKREQKKLHGGARFSNAKIGYKKRIDLSGKTLIIVDDVITTGASVASSAGALYSLGAREVVAASMAIAYMDKYSHPQF